MVQEIMACAPMRRCTRCRTEFPATLEFFSVHKMGRYGLHSQCRPCKREAEAEKRARPDQQARQQAWRDANKEYARRYNEAYRAAGYKSTVHAVPWQKKRYREDPVFNLTAKLRSAIRSRAVQKVKDVERRTGAARHLEFTAEELRDHLERQFTKGMTWERLLAGEIHIDHILPVASFNIQAAGDPEFRACWALSNLRPMWATDNMRKNDRVESLL